MVTILSLAFTAESGIEQERITSSLMCTEQAPHCATPQPYFVPVRLSCSRSTHNSGVSASTSTSRFMPLMLSFAMSFLSRKVFDVYPIVLRWRRWGDELETVQSSSHAIGKHSAFRHPLPTAVARAAPVHVNHRWPVSRATANRRESVGGRDSPNHHRARRRADRSSQARAGAHHRAAAAARPT